MIRNNSITLVLGATGQQGGATARALAADDRRVRALVRDPQSTKAKALSQLGIETVQGDLRDKTSLTRALSCVHGVFVALPSSADAGGITDDDELNFGRAVIDAAKHAGVLHLIYSSTIGASPDLGLGHYESKWHIENHLRDSGVPFTIVRPAPFMEMLLLPHFGLGEGVATFFSAPDQVVQFIAVRDIGFIAARLFAATSRPEGQTMDIAGDALSGNEIAAKISRATDRDVPYLQIANEVARQNPLLERLLAASTTGELDGHADMAALRALHPGLHTFDQWLEAGHAEQVNRLLPDHA